MGITSDTDGKLKLHIISKLIIIFKAVNSRWQVFDASR